MINRNFITLYHILLYLKSSILLVNYAARDAGIKRHVTVSEALMKCPQLRLVHVPTYSITTSSTNENKNQSESDSSSSDEIVAIPQYCDEMPAFRADGTRLPPNPPDPSSNKACLEPYRQASMAIFRLIRDWCSKLGEGVIFEKGGLDEAFIDITEQVEQELIEEFDQKYTMLRDELADVENEELELEALENLKLYDVQWIETELDFTDLGQNAIPKNESVSASASASDENDNYSDVEKMRMALGKLRIWKGAQISKELRSRLHKELNFIASIGIAPNKMLAKLVSALYKPDRQTRIEPGEISEFMRRVPFEKIRMMGGKMGQSVLKNKKSNNNGDDGSDNENESDHDHENNENDIDNSNVKAADLWPLSVKELTERVGDTLTAHRIHQLIRGHDPSPLTPRSLPKSFMSAKSFRPAVRGWPELHDWMVILVGELWSRIGEEKEGSGRWPSNITIHWKSFKYSSSTSINNKGNTWNNTGAVSKSCEFPYASSIPSQATRPLFLAAVFRLLTPHTETLFPLSRLAVSVGNFKGGEGVVGGVASTRVDQYFKRQTEIVNELPASMDRFFKPLPLPINNSLPSSKSSSKKSVFEMLLATVKHHSDTTSTSFNTNTNITEASSNNNFKVLKSPNLNLKKKRTSSNTNNDTNNTGNNTILKFFKNNQATTTDSKFCCKDCTFKCSLTDEKVIQEHCDYHLAINLSRSND